MVSCAKSDGGDRVNSLAFDSSLSLESQWQTVLFLTVPGQNQSSVMDLNNSSSSLSLTSRDLLHTFISHWIHNLTQEESWTVTQCLTWSWANAGGRSTLKSFDKRYFLDNEHSYRKKLYQIWNEYGLPNICFQLLLILCEVKSLMKRGRVFASYMPGYSIWKRWVLCHPCVLRVEKGMLETLLTELLTQLTEGLWEGERKLLFYYKVCQMISEKMWYHSYALPSWRDAAHLGSHLELTYNSFGLVWALSETAPYAVFT